MTTSDKSAIVVTVCAVTAVALLIFVRTPYAASNLEMAPDSAEYAIGASHIVSEGEYFISVDGRKLPPRYSSWFPILLTPAYQFIGTDEIGNGILPVTLFAITGVLAAFAIGRRLSGLQGGIAAAAILMLLPDYTSLARQIMSDVPATALVLLACAVFLRLNETEKDRYLHSLSLGILVALACALRPLLAALLLPPLLMFIRKRLNPPAIFIILAPSLAVFTLNFLHNYSTFGSPFRNGYNFWCPVPYDYPGLTFSFLYLPENLLALLCSPVIALCVVALLSALLLRRAGKAEPYIPPGLSLFVSASCIPYLTIHLLYFYPDTRFFLPVAALLACVCGGAAGRLTAQLSLRTARIVFSIVLAAVIVIRFISPRTSAAHRKMADAILAHTPDDAAIITAADPVYLEYMTAEQSHRKIIPLSRNTEYASKLLAPVRFGALNPPPANWWDHRCEGLIKAGASEAYAEVALEQQALLVVYILSGRRVFLSTDFPTQADADSARILSAQFNVAESAPGLLELSLKKK